MDFPQFFAGTASDVDEARKRAMKKGFPVVLWNRKTKELETVKREGLKSE